MTFEENTEPPISDEVTSEVESEASLLFIRDDEPPGLGSLYNFRQDAGVAQQDVETSHAPFHFLAHRAAFLPLRDFPDATVLTFRQLSKGMEPTGRSASDPLSEATDRPGLLWRGHVPIASTGIEALAG